MKPQGQPDWRAALDRLLDAIASMRELIDPHDALDQPGVGPVYDDVQDFIAALQSREIAMTDKKDYEALGRYVDAHERVQHLAVQRHNLSNEVTRLLEKANLFQPGMSGDTVSRFDHAATVSKVEELAELNVQLEAAIAQMNSNAAAARKPPLRRV